MGPIRRPGAFGALAFRLPGLALGLALGVMPASGQSGPAPVPANQAAAQGDAPAQKLVASLSTKQILIKSNFAGETVTIFGAMDRTAISGTGAPVAYDAVVTVRGPRGAVTVRRKQRWGPFWFNLDNRKYIGIPAYIAILSNRNVKQIASAAVRDDLRIGIDALIPRQVARRGANDPEFRAGLRRLRARQGLFVEDENALTFISPRVFQASVNLPGRVPLGKYDVDVAVFEDGALEARSTLTFAVTKTDVEQAITSTSRDHPVLYGLVIILLALLIGWIASVIFRRD